MVLQLTTINPARVKTFAKKILAVDVKAGKKLFHQPQRCCRLKRSHLHLAWARCSRGHRFWL